MRKGNNDEVEKKQNDSISMTTLLDRQIKKCIKEIEDEGAYSHDLLEEKQEKLATIRNLKK